MKTLSKYIHTYRNLVVVLFVLLSTFGCKPELDLVNPNALNSVNFWSNAEEAEQGLIAVYATLPTVHSFGRMGTGIMLIQRGDDVDPYELEAVNGPGTFAASPTQPRMNEFWSEINKTVSTANQVIHRVPDIDMDETRKSQIIAEARFLRGFAHFYIFHTWGPHVPLYKNLITSTEDIQLPAASAAEFYASMEEDFRAARDGGLPMKWDADNYGRASQGAAMAMLGKVLLYQEKWSEAATEFAKLLDGQYSLVANYEDNFNESGVNNAESLFEIQYDGNINGGWGGSGGNNWRGQAWENDIAPRLYTSQASVDVNQWVLDLFMAQTTNGSLEDPRAKATMVWDYPGAMVYQDPFSLNYGPSDILVRKYLNFEHTRADDGGWPASLANWRVIRYADVLLMYAEAENEANGGSANALARLNEVRQRVDMPDYPSMNQTDMRNAIRDERVRELSIEGHRWFDLLRWGIAADIFINNPERRANSVTDFVRGKHEYLPVPQVDVDNNPNLDQNPAYQ
ncbi:RagB/SusD family nutrient uptake outer membrane protein [Fulvivirgaceae bacterium BMA10]|uniref:RagB/SusD family nutrient uptake outer membrane protein n=1 Tax=Splendidivirga corallicola TaxID=3051826 RepID=A0ABT8KY42_9BACT|nr:RagB/SusD family nutrient uptake outer membrane protein [Fulvivirgaceae bacterium BMA10]